MSSQNAGGTATQAGINYQNRVAAWFAVRVLAEAGAEPLEGMPTTSTLEFLRCETEQPVDDLMVGTSEGGHLFIQVKRSLNLDSAIESRFQSTVNQFVRQFLAYRDVNGRGSRPSERPVEFERDRIILVTSSRSSATIREVLPGVLHRAVSLEADQPIDQCATSSDERRVLLDGSQYGMETLREDREFMTSHPSEDGRVGEILTLLHDEADRPEPAADLPWVNARAVATNVNELNAQRYAGDERERRQAFKINTGRYGRDSWEYLLIR